MEIKSAVTKIIHYNKNGAFISERHTICPISINTSLIKGEEQKEYKVHINDEITTRHSSLEKVIDALQLIDNRLLDIIVIVQIKKVPKRPNEIRITYHQLQPIEDKNQLKLEL